MLPTAAWRQRRYPDDTEDDRPPTIRQHLRIRYATDHHRLQRRIGNMPSPCPTGLCDPTCTPPFIDTELNQLDRSRRRLAAFDSSPAVAAGALCGVCGVTRQTHGQSVIAGLTRPERHGGIPDRKRSLRSSRPRNRTGCAAAPRADVLLSIGPSDASAPRQIHTNSSSARSRSCGLPCARPPTRKLPGRAFFDKRLDLPSLVHARAALPSPHD